MENHRIFYLLLCTLICFSCISPPDFQSESFNLPEHSTLGATELFRISSPTDGTFFSYIRKIHILSDGDLIVQNYPDYQLYEFSQGGELIGIIGGRGRGPGEFIETYISHLTAEDSLHVYDFNNARHQVFAKNHEDGWEYRRERVFRRVHQEGLKEQIPEKFVSGIDGMNYGLFQVFPKMSDTLNAHYKYVAEVDHNIEHIGEISRPRLEEVLAIHRGADNSMSITNNRRFYRVFYQYDPDRDEVIVIENISNKIIGIDSSGNETIKGYLPYERFPINRAEHEKSLKNVNYYYSGMGEIVRSKLLEHEPYYWNVIFHENRLWINLAQSDSSSPNWVITTLEGEVLESFHGPKQISEVAIRGNRMYGSIRNEDEEVYLTGYELTGK